MTFGEHLVKAEIADDTEERRTGLMNRKTLADDAGMLFVFQTMTNTGFWMKNTLIPLSIAYMRATSDDSYEVLAILDMEPCKVAKCPLYPPGVTYDRLSRSTRAGSIEPASRSATKSQSRRPDRPAFRNLSPHQHIHA